MTIPSGETPAKRVKRFDESVEHPSIEVVLNEVKELRNDVMDVMKLSKYSKLPPGLRLLLSETFKCSICQDIIHPPVAYTRCCRSIAGCEQCFDFLYGSDTGRTKCCPLCRSEERLTSFLV